MAITIENLVFERVAVGFGFEVDVFGDVEDSSEVFACLAMYFVLFVIF